VFDEGPAPDDDLSSAGPVFQRCGYYKQQINNGSKVNSSHQSSSSSSSRAVGQVAATTTPFQAVPCRRTGSNSSINSVGSTTSSVSAYRSMPPEQAYLHASSSTYSTSTLGRMTKAIRKRYRRTSGPSGTTVVPSYAQSTPNTPDSSSHHQPPSVIVGAHAAAAATAAKTNSGAGVGNPAVAYAMYYSNAAITGTASQGEIYHSASSGRWRYRSSRGPGGGGAKNYMFQSGNVGSVPQQRRSSHGDLTSTGNSGNAGAGFFAGDCGGGFRYSSTEDLFEQQVSASNSRRTSVTSLNGGGGGDATTALRHRFLYGPGGHHGATEGGSVPTFDLRAATEQLQHRTMELTSTESGANTSAPRRKCKYMEWAI